MRTNRLPPIHRIAYCAPRRPAPPARVWPLRLFVAGLLLVCVLLLYLIVLAIATVGGPPDPRDVPAGNRPGSSRRAERPVTVS